MVKSGRVTPSRVAGVSTWSRLGSFRGRSPLAPLGPKIAFASDDEGENDDNNFSENSLNGSYLCGDGRNSSIMTEDRDKSLSIPPSSPSLPSKLTTPSKYSSGGSSPMHSRLVRTLSARKRKGSADSTDSRGERKKNEKKNAYAIQALFDAVEHQDMDMAKRILETNGLDVNSVNSEEFTPLEIAIMTNHIPMAKMLLTCGARDNSSFDKENASVARLATLVEKAERKVEGISNLVSSQSNSNISTCQNKENERQLSNWEFRHRLLKRMEAGYDYAHSPDSPNNVTLTVASDSSLLVRFEEPDNHNGAVVTKYKVEWSCFDDFCLLAGDAVVEDLQNLELEIPNLVKGNKYYVRVKGWNIKGFGPESLSTPAFAIPSSWRELNGAVARAEGKLKLMEDLFVNVKNSRPADAPEIKDPTSQTGSPMHGRKTNMRKSIKNLFTSAPKFQKSLKRGVYMASLVYNEDQILVTNEDTLPIVEVDEKFSAANHYPDFHWLMKVACTWEDVKALRQDMDGGGASSSTILFRSKLLQAAAQLQSALGIQDLGQFYFTPIKEHQGGIILTTITYVRDPRIVNTSSLKWQQLKLQKRFSSSDAQTTPDVLMATIPAMISYNQLSAIPLSKGLYLGYLKLRSSVDQIRVLVPEKMPNVLPYVKIRECQNVSKEEWQWLQSLDVSEVKEPPTTAQSSFQRDLADSCKRLLESLDLDEEEAVSHRIYDLEVIELSPEISFIILVPPAEGVCSVAGHSNKVDNKPDLLSLPVQVFEMIHMCTYEYDFISRYSRLSSIIEMDSYLAVQARREAFSSEELTLANKRVDQLLKFQQGLEEAWKGMRWTMDIITYSRDKNVRGGVPLGILYAPHQTTHQME